MNERTRVAYAYGKHSPLWRILGFALLAWAICILALLGLYDVLLWLSEAVA